MVELGVALAYKAVDEYLTRFETVADLSCGNAEVVRRMSAELSILPEYAQLGDFAPGYQYHGPIERMINEILNVDLFVMGETLEHLDDPLAVLRQVREKTTYLLLSTTIDCWEDSNDDHYWAWSREGVEELFEIAGFTVVAHDAVDSRTYGEPYTYGIWVCRISIR